MSNGGSIFGSNGVYSDPYGIGAGWNSNGLSGGGYTGGGQSAGGSSGGYSNPSSGGGGYADPGSWRNNAGLGQLPPSWTLQTGGPDPSQNNQTAAANTPGAPSWLQSQLGQFLNQTYNTNPQNYGRWNWAGPEPQGVQGPGAWAGKGAMPTQPMPGPTAGPAGSGAPPTSGPGTPFQTPAGAVSQNWINFKFGNPTNPFEQNFNAIAGKNPYAAFSYGLAQGGGPGAMGAANDLRTALKAAGYNDAGIQSAFAGGGVDPTSALGKSLGLTNAWGAPDPGRGYFDPLGKTYNFQGNTYDLSNQVNTGSLPSWIGGGSGYSNDPTTAAYQKQNLAAMGNQGAGGIGTPAWYAALQGK
jgi:hypothetical protein